MSMHMVRLMHFIPGVMLYDVPNTPEILVQSGDQLGRIANTIKVILTDTFYAFYIVYNQ